MGKDTLKCNMKNGLFVFLMVLLLSSSAVLSQAQETFIVGSFRCEIMDDSASVRISAIGADSSIILAEPRTEVRIPASVIHDGRTYHVKEIGRNAFGLNNDVRKIVIDNGIEKIDRYAFAFCLSLESAYIPASVTNIEENIFYGCDNLSEITVDKGNPRYDSRDNCNAIIITQPNTLIEGCYTTLIPKTVRFIGGDAFNGCNRLTKLVIPEGVTELGRGAVRNCPNLSRVYISSTVDEIRDNVFHGCTSLKEILVDKKNEQYDSRDNSNGVFCGDELVIACSNTIIPKGVKRIVRNPFVSASSMVEIPEGIEIIEENAFIGQKDIMIVLLPKSLKTIEDGAFENCSNLRLVGFNGSLEEFPQQIFCNCSSLEFINIPFGVKKIGKEAFKGCKNLKKIVIPSTVIEIDEDAFLGAPCEEEVGKLF